MPSKTPTVFQMTSINEKISKGTIAAVVVVIGLLLLGTITGLYYKYEKKRKAWVRQKEAEEKWRDVYGRDNNVVNPINFEIKNFHDMTVDNFFGRSSEIALTNIIHSTDIENSSEVVSATIDTASTTINSTTLSSNSASKFTKQQMMSGYQPKVNILEKKLKKRANDERLSAKSENT